MSDAKLWIDEVGCTAMITRPNVSYTMPLWVFEDMREIIVAKAEKKVEVTHRDFDIQQELLDRYRAENAKLRQQLADVTESMGRVEERCAKLRELASGLRQCFYDEGCEGCPMQDDGGWCVRDIRLRELGIEVDG